MKARIPLLSLLFCLMACQATKPVSNNDNSLQGLVERVRAQYNMPGMAVAVVQSSQIKEIAVAGIRRLDQKNPVEQDDRFQLGPLTKTITAHWAATLVEAKLIQWDTKILDVFPEWRDHALKTYHRATLSDLLAHRAYIQAFNSADDMAKIPRFGGTARAQRQAFAKWLLRQNPAPIGAAEGYTYSDAGYSLATAMLEKVSDTAWEEAILRDVLPPMQVNALVGWPTDANLAQPFGHHARHPLDSNLRPVTAANMFPIPPALAPANGLSASIGNYAKFVQAHLQGVRGQANHLEASTYEYLHYGRESHTMGWTRLTRKGIHISSHDGSAGTFYAHTSIYKEQDLALVIFVNASNIYATKAVYSLKKRLLERYAPTYQ